MTPDAIEHAIAAHGWQRLTRGVLLTVPGSPSRVDWLNVGLHLTSPDGAISGWDAARIFGLGDREPPGAEVLILTRAGHHRRVGRVRIRPTQRPFATWMLPSDHPDHPYGEVVRAARAVTDTALQYRQLRPVRALVTSSVQRRRCTVEELLAELESGPRNGSALLRLAVGDARNGARSIAEAEAIDVLRRSPVPRFEANVPIKTVSGAFVAEGDCVWRELRAVLEIDSREYHFSEEDWNATMERHGKLARHGVSVLHTPPSKVRREPTRWAQEIEQWLRARAAELGIAYLVADDPLVVPAQPGRPRPLIVPDLLT